jgi:hypothetical protein
MRTSRANPQRLKINRSYTILELAECLGVHKNTVRHWQAKGLVPLDEKRPLLFQGSTARAFLAKQQTARKRPCPPGTLYCLRCREPREPALGMVDYVPIKVGSGNLRAFCGTCETIMHRRIRQADIAEIMGGCAVQFAEGKASLSGKAEPSLNCDFEGRH